MGKQEELFNPEFSERLMQFSREELVTLIKDQQRAIKLISRENSHLRALQGLLKQKTLFVSELFITLKNRLFGKSSERLPKEEGDLPTEDKKAKRRVQLPSLRYPNLPLVERDVTMDNPPPCACCGGDLKDSGMTEDSEFLTVIPAQYFVVRQKRHKYRCEKCHGDLQTTPAPPRIKEGSSYSDEMIQDVSLSKFCDLIPVERYCAIAARNGVKELPSQSLIEATHNLAEFLRRVADKIRAEVLLAKVLHADETPHRMLEGDEKENWYLWGFSTKKSSYFECHDTRSGDVASSLLIKSKCEFLVSDVFSGYAKAVRDTNRARAEKGLCAVKNVYCNSHARRKFKEAREHGHDASLFYLEQYREIYRLEGEARGRPPDEVSRAREKMAPLFAAMKERALSEIEAHPAKGSMVRALSYLLNNFEGLSLFLGDPELPIDNNPQERLLRNPVIGRKTWYGTHSRRGAQTAATLFTIIESCKLNRINPREYVKKIVEEIHEGKPALTPAEVASLAH